MRDRYYSDVARTGATGQSLLQQALGAHQTFDPTAAFRQRVNAAHGQFKDRFTQDLARLRGSQVGMGRLNTGFAVGDEDRLFRTLGNDAQQQIGQAALQTSGQQLSHLGMLGQLGSGLSGQAMDARAGEYHRLQDQRRLDEQESKRGWGSLLSGILGGAGAIAGFPLGGPAGATIGSKLYGKLFG